MKTFYDLSTDEKLIEIYGLIECILHDAEFKKSEIKRINQKLDSIAKEANKMDKIIRQNDYLINA